MIRAAGFALLATIVFKFVLMPVRVTGVSMEPTYNNGMVKVINRLAYVGGEPRRGDIVAVTLTGHSVMFLKRIIALPGETVSMKNGVVLINGEPLTETYTAPNPYWNFGDNTMRDDEYLVIGDNRSMRQDEHEFGAVTADRIVGKVAF